MSQRLRTAVIGFGKIGAGYADDPIMARHFAYASHAQALRGHSAFDWEAVVDPSPAAREQAMARWGIRKAFSDVAELASECKPEVIVLATPPESRLGIVEALPSLRAILVEKPLGRTLADGRVFVDACRRRGILVQVNLLRRADERLEELANGGLCALIGQPQAVFGVYGNGLLNNGTHMVDLVRMLLGEVDRAEAVRGVTPYAAGPIDGDSNMPFTLVLEGGIVAMFQPVTFGHYRENSLDIWGTRGRLEIRQEGLSLMYFPRRPNRAMRGEFEIASDEPHKLDATLGHAFLRMYDNLAAAIAGRAALCSPGASALRTAEIIEALRHGGEIAPATMRAA